jgi:2-oxoisovalerate dehydrogenase E1 component
MIPVIVLPVPVLALVTLNVPEDLIAAAVKTSVEIVIPARAVVPPTSPVSVVVPAPFVSSKYPEGTHQEAGEAIKFIDALNGTLKAEFRHNPDTYIWGQDVANKEKGGIFNVTKGMQQEFGRHRVFNGPIAEDFILGTANGFSRFDKKIR